MTIWLSFRLFDCLLAIWLSFPATWLSSDYLTVFSAIWLPSLSCRLFECFSAIWLLFRLSDCLFDYLIFFWQFDCLFDCLSAIWLCFRLFDYLFGYFDGLRLFDYVSAIWLCFNFLTVFSAIFWLLASWQSFRVFACRLVIWLPFRLFDYCLFG